MRSPRARCSLAMKIASKRKRLRKAIDPTVEPTDATSLGCCERVIFFHEIPGESRKPATPTGRRLYYKLNGAGPCSVCAHHRRNPQSGTTSWIGSRFFQRRRPRRATTCRLHGDAWGPLGRHVGQASEAEGVCLSPLAIQGEPLPRYTRDNAALWGIMGLWITRATGGGVIGCAGARPNPARHSGAPIPARE